MAMAESDVLVDDFPPFDSSFPPVDPSDLSFLDDSHLYPDGDFPLPDGLSSDLDFDNFDFSIDDLLLPDNDNDNDDSHLNQLLSESNPNPQQQQQKLNISNPSSPESVESSIVNTAEEQSKTKSLLSVDEDNKKDWTLKRKKKDDEFIETGNNPPNPNSKRRTVKHRRKSDDKAEDNSNNNNSDSSNTFNAGSGEEEKRKARLMRNRESAQLSRQRKKHYVEELEDKVKSMSSTIAKLHTKISFIMAENANLRQQLSAGSGNNSSRENGGGIPPSPVVYPPPPLMHWMIPPYNPMVRHANGQVPLVAIPKLKPLQQPPPVVSKSKRKSESRTKKVASVSLIGLLLVMLCFSGLVNFGFRGSGDGVGVTKGRILGVSGGSSANGSVGDLNRRCQKAGMMPLEKKQNSTESLRALLYVPRNGRHVAIHGNLIIQSVLASEIAMAQAESNTEQSSGKSAVTSLISALALPKGAREMGRRYSKPYLQRAIASDSQVKSGENLKSSLVDGPLQQWFREGMAGQILSSGTCTEVFQFEVSPSSSNPSGIVPATSVDNATEKIPSAAAQTVKTKNRRILYPQAIPLPGISINNTDNFGEPSQSGSSFHGNGSTPSSSMVVSILADPREGGDGDGDGMIAPKSLSRIFVVVLMDSVKYVTYSCVLPLKNHGQHLVN